jgi:WD40 repeat protein
MDGIARIWDVRKKALLREIHIGTPIYAVAFSPDGHRILTGCWSKTAQVWDAESLKPIGEPLRHDNSVWAVAWSPDGEEILTGSFDKTARLWDAKTQQPIGDPLRHGDYVMAAAFSPDGRTMLTGSSDRVVRLWRVTADNDSTRRETKAAAILPDAKNAFVINAIHSFQLWRFENLGRSF